VRKWVTYHGFALNVDPNMSHFGLINPCGLNAGRITSMAELLGNAPDMRGVRQACARGFANTFGVELKPNIAQTFPYIEGRYDKPNPDLPPAPTADPG
jgi:lipoate-protein ligase B